MGPNVVAEREIIKHLFDRVVSRAVTMQVVVRSKLVGGRIYSSDTLAHMFGFRTNDRVQFEHKSEQ
jgi:hypothetical protein